MRTRVSTFTEPIKLELEKLLTFYCKKENLAYKQGLNEVAAPFINFRKAKVDLSNIYNYLFLFIDKFLPTAFIDKDFLSLQCCFKRVPQDPSWIKDEKMILTSPKLPKSGKWSR